MQPINPNFMGCSEMPQYTLSNCKTCILMPEVEKIRLLLCFMSIDCLDFSALWSVTMKTGQNFVTSDYQPFI